MPGSSRPPHTASSRKDYFDYWYGDRPDLGNTTRGDGYAYRGRGAIQITGRSAYDRVGAGIGADLIDDPDAVERQIATDMRAAAYCFAVIRMCGSSPAHPI